MNIQSTETSQTITVQLRWINHLFLCPEISRLIYIYIYHRACLCSLCIENGIVLRLSGRIHTLLLLIRQTYLNSKYEILKWNPRGVERCRGVGVENNSGITHHDMLFIFFIVCQRSLFLRTRCLVFFHQKNVCLHSLQLLARMSNIVLTVKYGLFGGFKLVDSILFIIIFFGFWLF